MKAEAMLEIFEFFCTKMPFSPFFPLMALYKNMSIPSLCLQFNHPVKNLSPLGLDSSHYLLKSPM